MIVKDVIFGTEARQKLIKIKPKRPIKNKTSAILITTVILLDLSLFLLKSSTLFAIQD